MKRCIVCDRKIKPGTNTPAGRICDRCWERWGKREPINGWKGLYRALVDDISIRHLIAGLVSIVAILYVLIFLQGGR